MSGRPVAESDVRSRLQTALAEFQAPARPLADLRRAVMRRRRQRQVAAMVAAGVLAGAGISIGLVATGGPGPHDRIKATTTADPVKTLHSYVVAQHGSSPTAALIGADGGTYAADIEGGKVHVLSFDGQGWASVAELGSPLPGPPIVAVRRGPDGAGNAAAFQVDVAGGDSVDNGIVVSDGGAWRYADFDCGTTTVACAGRGHRATKFAVDGTEVNGVFHSEPNSCSPSCVAGTRYDVTWRWDSTFGVFVVASAVKMP